MLDRMAVEDVDFVTCSTSQERLLLMLLRRIESLEAGVESLVHEVMGNPLEIITPSTCPSILQEGRHIARYLSGTDKNTFNTQPALMARTVQIKHRVNVDLLRRQGFRVEQCFKSPLPADYYTVTWDHKTGPE